MCAGRVQGTVSFPSMLRSRAHTECPMCGSKELGTSSLCCKVLRTHAVVDTTIEEQVCAACGHRVDFDGEEEFILWKCTFKSAELGTFELCFDWVLLYAVIGDVPKRGTDWFTSWVHCVDMYKVQGVCDKDLIAISVLYPHFREACMDFFDLFSVDLKRRHRARCNR